MCIWEIDWHDIGSDWRCKYFICESLGIQLFILAIFSVICRILSSLPFASCINRSSAWLSGSHFELKSLNVETEPCEGGWINLVLHLTKVES
jgi:hypothetical protein